MNDKIIFVADNNRHKNNQVRKRLIRDTVIVMSTFIFTSIWLVLTFGFKIDFSPKPNYFDSVLFNFLIPLTMIGVGHIIYAITLIIEAANSNNNRPVR